jgi:hypothetical protein
MFRLRSLIVQTGEQVRAIELLHVKKSLPHISQTAGTFLILCDEREGFAFCPQRAEQ